MYWENIGIVLMVMVIYYVIVQQKKELRLAKEGNGVSNDEKRVISHTLTALNLLIIAMFVIILFVGIQTI